MSEGRRWADFMPKLTMEQMITANILLDVLGIILTMIPIAYLLNGINNG